MSAVTEQQEQPPSQSAEDDSAAEQPATDDAFDTGAMKEALDPPTESPSDVIGSVAQATAQSAAKSFWDLASSVTSTVANRVSTGVGDPPTSLDALRHNMTTLAGSVKSVAESVQRNAQEMERAILEQANAAGTVQAFDGEVLLDDVGVGGGGGAEGAAVAAAAAVASSRSPAKLQVDEDVSGVRVEDEIAKVGELVGSSVIGKTVGGLWNELWGAGEGEDDDRWEMVQGGDSQVFGDVMKVPTTRFEKRIDELQANPDTYCEAVRDTEDFEKWSADFSLDGVASECIQILSRHDAIAELYERVVPNIVEEETFWTRYFYSKHVLELEEERRKRLLERAGSEVVNAEEDDEGWGDDDWGDDEEGDKEKGVQKPTAIVGIGGDTENEETAEGGPKGDTTQKDKEADGEDKSLSPEGEQKTTADAERAKAPESEDEGTAELEPELEEEKGQDQEPEAEAAGKKEEVREGGAKSEEDWGDDWE